MKTLTKVILFSLITTVTLMVFLLFRYQYISKAVFFIYIFFLIILEVVALIWSLSQKITKKSRLQKDTAKRNSFRYVFDKINDELEKMPDADSILWEKGRNFSSKTKEFTDSNGKIQRFVAVIGLTKYSRREVIIYYNTTEDIFWDWSSDPSPQQLADPFFNFQPYPRSGMGYDPYYRQPYVDKKKRTDRRGIRINFDDREGRDPNRDQIERHLDDIDLGNI